ncbi:MAG: hypothetical protein GC155_13265 [Alphaproteobacteria bacterium]|nr:hypothetical protein [Alphaproteobacteria bacterium]
MVAVFAIDRLCLWMEAKGWIYWRKVKRRGSAGAAALSTFNEAFDPSSRHAAEVREERQVEDEDDGDDDAQRPPEDRLT